MIKHQQHFRWGCDKLIPVGLALYHPKVQSTNFEAFSTHECTGFTPLCLCQAASLVNLCDDDNINVQPEVLSPYYLYQIAGLQALRPLL